MAGRIADSSIREVRDRAGIVEVVSETVTLSRAGVSFRGLCPFHGEKTPSFYVHPDRGLYKCFGCGEGGTVFDFLMKSRNMSFAEAVEDLADRYGIALKYEEGGAGRRPGEEIYGILRFAAETFRGFLRNSPGGRKGRDFFSRRGVTPEAESEFSLGYGGEPGEFLRALAKGGAEAEAAAKAGLLIPRDGGGYRERFAGRAIFPIADGRGRVVAFGGRILTAGEPKYINSPETDAYRKGSVLYGLYQALPHLRKEGRAVVVEGYLDLVSLWQRGVRNVVATCGTAFTPQQARLLKRSAGEVLLLFDGDAAGKKAALRAGEPLYAEGVSPSILFPPAGKDPDDWAKEASPEEIRGRIAAAPPLLDFVEQGVAAKTDFSEIRGRLAYVKTVARYLRWVGNEAELRLYANRVAERAGIPAEAVLSEVRGASAGAPRAATPPAPAQAAPPRRSDEELLLLIAAAEPSLAGRALADGTVARIVDEGVRSSVEFIASRFAAGAADSLLEGEGAPGALRRLLSGEAFGEGLTAERAASLYPDVAAGIAIRALEAELARLGAENKAAWDSGERERAQELWATMLTLRNEKDRLVQERQRQDHAGRP